MAQKSKKIATVKHPSIEAVVKQLYRLPDEKNALAKLDALKEHFIIAKKQSKDKKSLIIWIKDFEVSKEEKKQGYLGNFAMITHEEVDGGKHSLNATKVESELNTHPQRKYDRKQKLPNWGHPVLRGVKKGKIYESVEAANNELQKLHESYPDSTIPGELKLYIMIFSRSDDKDNPVQKYIFEIKPSKEQEGGYFIKYKKNMPKAKPRRSSEPKDNKGYFTSMVNLKKKKPRKKPSSSSE